MNFYVLTLFPEMVQNCLGTSIIGKAADKGLLTIEAVNIRDYTKDRHLKVDDYPYGGGAGMVMQAQPIYDAWCALADRIGYRPRTIYLTPRDRHLRSLWQKRWHRKKIWFFSADIMKAWMNEFWKKL